MAIRVFLAFLCASGVFLAHAASNVAELNTANFKEALEDGKYTLVQFYAPWCDHCKEFAPIFERAADKMVGKVLLAKVDATKEGELARAYNISGFPTVKLFKGSEFVGNYQGEKNELGMMEWIMSKDKEKAGNLGNLLEKVVQKISSCDPKGVFTRKATEQVRFVYFGNPEATTALQMLESVGEGLRAHRVTFHIFAVLDQDCPLPEGASSGHVVVSSVFESDEKAPSKFLLEKEGLKAEDLKAWMIDTSIPPVGDIDDESSRKYFERNLPVFVAFLDPSDSSSKEKITGLLAELAGSNEFAKKFSFVTGDGQKYAQIVSAMGMDTKRLPQLAIDAIHLEERPTYPLFNRDNQKQDLNLGMLQKFAQDYLDGKLQEVDKKMKEDAKEPEGSEVKNFSDEDFKKAKKLNEWVLLLFTAPWSSEAHYASQVVRSLAAHYKKSKHRVNVVFGRVDVTEPSELNRDHSVNVPAVLLFQQGKEVSQAFDGEISEERLQSYLDRHFIKEVPEISGSAMATAFKEKNEAPYVLALLEDADTKQERMINYFKEVAEAQRGYYAWAIVSPAVQGSFQELQGMKPPAIAIVSKEGRVEPLSIPASTSDFKKTLLLGLEKSRVPTILVFDREHGPLVSKLDTVPTLMIFLPASEYKSNYAVIEAAVKEREAQYRGQIIFLVIDVTKTPQVADMLKVSKNPNDLPAVRLDGRKSKIPGMFAPSPDFKYDAQHLQDFADAYFKGSLEPTPRSAETPTQAYEKGVKVVVGSTLKALILDEARPTLLYIYSPTCQYCKMFTPIYEAWAKELDKEHKDVAVVAKMDATENDAPSFVKIPGYPSVFLFKPGDKRRPVLYDGQPNIGGLREWWKAELMTALGQQIRQKQEL